MAKKEKSPKEIAFLIEKIIKDTNSKFKFVKNLSKGITKKKSEEEEAFKKLSKKEQNEITAKAKEHEQEQIKIRRVANDKIRNERILYVVKTCEKHNISPHHIIQIMNLNNTDTNSNNYDTEDDF